MSVSGEIIKVLDALSEKFGLAIDWSAKNIIPYFEELCAKYINYEVATSIVCLIIGIILLVLPFVLIKKCKYCYKIANDNENYDYSTRDNYCTLFVILSVIMIVSTIVGIVMVWDQTFDIVTCYTLPEKILLEEIMEIYETIK
jgi:hypothetical protein